MTQTISIRKRLVGTALLSLSYFGVALFSWYAADGRLDLFADTVIKDESISFTTQDDWQKGTFTKTSAENGALKLVIENSTPTTSPSPSPSQSTVNAPATMVTTAAWKKKSQSNTNASCTAWVPDDFWVVAPGDVSGVRDSVHKQWVGYSVPFINPALQPYAGAYGAPLNDPDLYSADRGTAAKAWGHLVLSGWEGPGEPDTSALNFTSEYNEQIGDYTLRSVESNNYKGIVFYHTNGINSNLGYGYFVPARWAFTKKADWPTDGAKVAQIAATHQCTLTGNSMSFNNTVKVGGNDGASTDKNGSDDGYNPWLGTEYVHDSNGNNYYVSPSTQWSDTGPQGAGYYVPTSGGNSYELLQPGRVD